MSCTLYTSQYRSILKVINYYLSTFPQQEKKSIYKASGAYIINTVYIETHVTKRGLK